MPGFDRTRKPYDRPTPTAPRTGVWLHDRAPGAVATQPTSRLIVSNLHWEVTVKDLDNIFSTLGDLVREPVIRVRIHTSGTATEARFDRSGRSTGVAFISYSSNDEAAHAKDQLDGKIAKSQAMSIAYDTSTPRIPSSVQAAARKGSLLNRVSKPPLLSRLSADISVPFADSGPGPIRARHGARGAMRSAAPRAKKPKTLQDLDKELEAFMSKENGDVDTTT